MEEAAAVQRHLGGAEGGLRGFLYVQVRKWD